MQLSLIDIKRLATEIAKDEDPSVQVVAALNAEGAAQFAELVLTRGNHERRQQLVIGVTRELSESEARSVLRARFRELHQRI